MSQTLDGWEDEYVFKPCDATMCAESLFTNGIASNKLIGWDRSLVTCNFEVLSAQLPNFYAAP